MRSILGLTRTCHAALLRSLLAALAFICCTQDSAVRAQASRVELDHVFVVVRPGAVAELAALRSAGFTVGREPIRHVGQGTASVAAYFENGYLELIWLDSTVSTDPDHANTARWFRAAAAWRTTGHSPFGVGLHRLPGDSGALPVAARLEAAPWLGPDQAYELLHTPADSLAADFFVVPPKAAVPNWIGRARQREPELWQHRNGSRVITLVRLHGRPEHEPQARSTLRPGRIEFERASEPLLELHLDRGVPGGRLDLRPVLPLVLVQALETRIPGGQSRRSTGKASGGLEFRLPTGSQWEYAGRAGSVTATPIGAVLGTDQANFGDGHRDGTHSRGHRGGAWIAEAGPAGPPAACVTSRLAAPTTSASRSSRSSADGIDAGGRADRASRR